VIVEQLFPWNIALINVHVCVENSNELNPSIETFRVCKRECKSSGRARLPLSFTLKRLPRSGSSIQRVVTRAVIIDMNNETPTESFGAL
jgi:hypothetical protein